MGLNWTSGGICNCKHDSLLFPLFRYYMIQRAKDAQVVGIVVGTLGVGN